MGLYLHRSERYPNNRPGVNGRVRVCTSSSKTSGEKTDSRKRRGAITPRRFRVLSGAKRVNLPTGWLWVKQLFDVVNGDENHAPVSVVSIRWQRLVQTSFPQGRRGNTEQLSRLLDRDELGRICHSRHLRY